MVRGKFTPEGTTDEYKYEVKFWFDEHRQHSGRGFTERDFMDVDRLIVEVTSDQNERSFSTVWGPFDSTQFIEDILSYQYGKDGSKQF